MQYREYRPCARLAPLVACVWTLEGHAREIGSGTQPVLPDGRAELIVHFGDRFERCDPDGTRQVQPWALFAGQLDRALALRPAGRMAVLGVRFRPHGAACLIR